MTGFVPALVSPRRDRSLDLLRAGCTVLVVLLHAMMVGVTVADGVPVFTNALDTAWFAPVSWFVQMMPLFFLAGGATGLAAWRRAQAAGTTPGAFVVGRVRRLLAPALVVMTVMAGGLLALEIAGVPSDIVATAGFRMSQPLWFLGVFLMVQALVPAMAALHDRGQAWGIAALLAAVVGVDVARLLTGIEAIGFLNLAAVWLLVQQLGFFLADGRLAALARETRLALAAGALALLLVLTSAGPYSPDMYVNLNPPTLAIVLMGVGQAALLSLAQPLLRRLAEVAPVGRVADAIGARSMTVYLWHMPVLIGLAGLAAVLSLGGVLPLPRLGSPEWWVTRPVWLAVAVASVTLVSVAVAHVARVVRHDGSDRAARPAVAAALGVAAVAVVFVLGLTWISAGVSVLLMSAALRLTGGPGENPRASRGAARIPVGAALEQAGIIPAAEAYPTRA